MKRDEVCLLRVISYELRITNYELRITNYEFETKLFEDGLSPSAQRSFVL